MVISIILILASILLPVLKKVREKAKEIACVNNLKQIGTCVGYYTDDYMSYLPVNHSSLIYWPNAAVYPYLEEKACSILACPQNQNQESSPQILKYYYNANLIDHVNRRISYGYNDTYLGYTAYRNLSSIKNNTLVFTDNRVENAYSLNRLSVRYNMAPTDWQVAGNRHGGRTNAIFIDFHIKSFLFNDLNTTLLYWSGQ